MLCVKIVEHSSSLRVSKKTAAVLRTRDLLESLCKLKENITRQLRKSRWCFNRLKKTTKDVKPRFWGFKDIMKQLLKNFLKSRKSTKNSQRRMYRGKSPLYIEIWRWRHQWSEAGVHNGEYYWCWKDCYYWDKLISMGKCFYNVFRSQKWWDLFLTNHKIPYLEQVNKNGKREKNSVKLLQISVLLITMKYILLICFTTQYHVSLCPMQNL